MFSPLNIINKDKDNQNLESIKLITIFFCTFVIIYQNDIRK